MAARSAASGWDGSRSAAGNLSPWLMTAIVSVATAMEILDVSIANVSLSNIAGSLSVAQEKATWMVTSYLVANAIIIPISGFLSRAIGRKRYFLFSIAIFTAASLMCALSPNLGFLIVARVLQGIGGGGLAPVQQSMITDSFPPHKRGQAFAAFGMVVVVAPIVGPTIGGYITDSISWHWIFLINVPVGVLSLFLVSLLTVEPKVLVEERKERYRRGLKVDYIGFIFTAIGLAGLLITLDRGQTENWFESDLIVTTAILAAVGLTAMAIWETLHDDPIVPVHLLKIPNFAISVLMMLMLGMLVFGTIQIVPQMLQQVYGYTAYDAGLALTFGGFAAIVMMPLTGVLTSKIDARMLLFPAFVMQAASFWHFSDMSTQSTFWGAVLGRFYQSVALPFLFIPINTVAYVGLPPEDSDKASAMLNFARNLGGAFGISIAQTLLARREQFHQWRMTEGLNMLNSQFSTTLHQLTQSLGSRTQALAVIYRMVEKQSAMFAYVDVYYVLMWGVIVILPMIPFLKTVHGNRG
ncbi:DHA2 family efflux MFS transporter permease subunit [Pararhizobium mangrovi]|uniref:DHA2 family efflux MFS transporter permease subunit n=1 Tax=Pararhizobium mangrovi TaxID=2590452 RepID=A0A506TV39_9HYPH|nr:DHA2 family efflux MFS transporter permease subunit [Pararhizobium mangrovi]TPW25933.1 DHA2 family efflux MFS transporter permease subunit [Pararhizobium mangrovi]